VAAKILLIDDDPALLSLMAMALKHAGYVIETAADGLQGVQKLDRYDPDLVITDIVMPAMEGIGAIREIRKRRLAHPPKVIAISGAPSTSTAKYLEWAKHLGADEVLAKPFRMSELIELSANVIASRPAAA
jgi:DNA-binding response OmpR family regulator